MARFRAKIASNADASSTSMASYYTNGTHSSPPFTTRRPKGQQTPYAIVPVV